MKLLRLRLSNLASLAGEQTLDYRTEPLASAGLMAITGPTGSGKSTILDALCLALFGQVPRLRAASKGQEGKVPDGLHNDPLAMHDPRTLLRRGTAKGFAEVLFVGQDGREYCASWQVRRARDKSDGRLLAAERILKDEATGQTLTSQVRETDARIAELIGLSFEQFTRAVMLAQSEFGAFLKASDTERAQLLERLLATDIYRRIGILAHEKSKQYKDTWQLIKTQMGGLVALDPEQRLALEESLSALNQQREQLSQYQANLHKTQAWYLERNQLGIQIDAARQAVEATSATWHSLASSRTQAQQLEQLHLIRPDIGRKQELSTQISRQRHEHAALHLQLQQTQTMLGSAKEAYCAAEQTAEHINNQLVTTKPDLQRATQLEHELDRLHRDQSDLDTVLLTLRQQSTATQQAITDNQHAQQQCQNMLIALETQLNHSQLLAALDEHWPAKLARMEDAQQLSRELEQVMIAAPQREQDYKALTATLEQLASQLAAHQQQFGTEALKNEQLSGLKTQLQSCRVTDQQLQALSQQYQGYRHLWTQLTAQREKHRLRLKHRDDLAPILQQAQQDSLKAELELNILLKVLAGQRLIRSKSVADLRNQLQPDQPCPVCGSPDHPYAVTHLLEVIQQEDEQQEQRGRQRLGAAQKQQQSIDTELTLITRELDQLEGELTRLSNEEKAHKYALMQLPMATELRNHSSEDSERLAWLREQITVNQRTEQQIHAQLTMLEQQLATEQALVKQLEQTRLQHSQAEHTWQSITQQQTALQGQLHATEQHFWSSLKGELQQQWRHDLSQTLNQIQHDMDIRLAQQADTVRQQEQLNTLIHDQKPLAVLQAQEQARLQELVQQATAVTAQRQRQQAQLDALLQQASAALAREISTVAQWQTRLDEQQAETQLNLENKRQEHQQLEQQHQQLTIQLEHRAQQTQDDEQTLGSLVQRIAAWHEQHPTLSDEAFTTLLAVSAEQEQQLKMQLQQAQTELTETETRLHVYQLQFEKHQHQGADNLPLLESELAAALDMIGDQWEQSQQQWLALQLQLKQDDECKAKASSLQGELDLAYADYARIDRMAAPIASADGKLFQKYAQEYFLDRLLDDANLQLEQLSRRYQLERAAGSLGLLVIDTDMGDERRSVHSLSGGESFLVSLALALGLAEMASNRLRIESLFIDEGFGTLDPDSLQIVMDALDRLQGQGRKVTVITHVQDMHERIPTQIQVHKKGNGQSELIVV